MFEEYIKEILENPNRKEDEIFVKNEFFYSKDFDLNSKIFNQKIFYPKIKKLSLYFLVVENLKRMFYYQY